MYLRVSLLLLISAGIYSDPCVRTYVYNQKFMTFATVRSRTENCDEFIFINCALYFSCLLEIGRRDSNSELFWIWAYFNLW